MSKTTWPAGSKAPPVSHPSRLCYCAPEVVANPALPLRSQSLVPVTTAADIWSIGLVAYEVLTQERAFKQGATSEDILSSIGSGMPWESGVAGAEQRNTRLGRRRKIVLACLDRDASKRPCIDVLLSHWKKGLDYQRK